ncbi:MAG: alpha/beta fold hydrolase [Myxococcales bacterium]|nr:alpha/beta fold hydrolase [Myxococcales bacterium]
MRTDYDARAVKRGAARAAAAWLAHAALYGFGFLPSRHRRLRAPGLRTLVFVHGLAGNRANFFPLQAYLRACGYHRQLSFNYPSSGSIERIAVLLKRQLDDNVKGGRIDLIAHSMGGLVARLYVQQLGGARRVDRLITLGTPHHGSTSSAYLPLPLVSQLKPSGPFLQHLNGLGPPPGVSMHSFAGERDLLVLPPEAALAPFGESVMLPELGHLDMLLSPRVFRAVRDRLRAGVERAPRADAATLAACPT